MANYNIKKEIRIQFNYSQKVQRVYKNVSLVIGSQSYKLDLDNYGLCLLLGVDPYELENLPVDYSKVIVIE